VDALDVDALDVDALDVDALSNVNIMFFGGCLG
jgi:hypothetical protein